MIKTLKNIAVPCVVLGLLLNGASATADSVVAEPGQGYKNRYRIQNPPSKPSPKYNGVKNANPGPNHSRKHGRANGPNGPGGSSGPKGPSGPNGPGGPNGPNGPNGPKDNNY